MIEIRQATAWDTAAIADIKRATWTEETTSPLQIAIALSQATHFAAIASIDKTPVGYISCFQTQSDSGVKRWEIDEIAVLTSHRRKGIAQQLIFHGLDAGKRRGASTVRALIRVDNIPSQRAFAAHGLETDLKAYNLFIHEEPLETDQKLPDELYPVEVYTMSYHGYWLEGTVDIKALQLAPKLLKAYQHDSVGVLIPKSDARLNESAQAAGYEWVALYNWWKR